MLIVLLTNRKDYEPFLADVVFAFDELGNLGIISHGLTQFFRVLDFRYPPAGGSSFACRQTWGDFNTFSNKSQEKTVKKLATEIETVFNFEF